MLILPVPSPGFWVTDPPRAEYEEEVGGGAEKAKVCGRE